ncbi:MAG TPA: N-6 DNA methylase [Verrucomicrobiae bacterium]|nr:N-6 DNA methylase [Verrucomicrobiae bacterium]
MKPDDILIALQDFTASERIEFLPLAETRKPSPYAPIEKYLQDLQRSKPESAAEDLLSALWKEVIGVEPTRQVGVSEGFVDFMLPESSGGFVPLELKPLFKYDSKDGSYWRDDAKPKNHVAQIRKYLRDNEYVILTDLRTAWFFGARDFYLKEEPFAEKPFTDFLARCRDTRSVLDTVRRLEDTAEKPELEQQFFDDLKKWFNEFEKIKWTPAEQKDESIILLINKLIFARTIEDFGLVPYRYTQDSYTKHTRDWQAKGAHKIVPKFLAEFEEFFDEYYDTEIFSARVWERLDKDPANLQRFCDKLNLILGINAWDDTFKCGIVHYNYRRIDEDIFGKSYEMFLAANRKGEGIYYTPAGITVPMADSMVNSLAGKITDEICDAVGSQKCDFKRADKLMAQLFEIRVADTACGSGGFLIKALRSFWNQYQRIDKASRWVIELTRPKDGEMYLAEMPPNVENALAFRRVQNLDNRRILIAQILLRHIFGADKDSGALEVAKTNIWKEAVKLSPADYNYRDLKTDVVKILPNLSLNFNCADSLVDVELTKQAEWLAEYHKTELKKLSELRARYIVNPMRHEALEEALALREKVRVNFVEHFASENLPCEPAGFALHFWPCWFTQDGKQSKDSGFHGIIGNPPWEGFKPIAKEFVAKLKTNFSKGTMTGTDFTPWFDKKLKDEPDFRAKWDEYVASYEKFSEFFGQRFQFQGGGDINLYKLFIEGDLNLVRDGGRLSLLVPSGLQTDEGCGPLRKLMLTENKFEELTSFENRGYDVIENGKEKNKQIFPDVDSRFKFGFFKVVKVEKPTDQHTFDARFYLHDPKDAFAPPIKYSVEMIRRFSPENFGIMEFRSDRDYVLCSKIRGEHSLLKDSEFRLSTEFHMTNDNHFFRKLTGKKCAAGQLLLYEGKMIHQFDADYSPGNYAVVEKEIREELLRKEIYRLAKLVREVEPKKLEGKPVPEKREELETRLREIFKAKKFKLQYEFPRTVYREIGRTTDERTIIATEVPTDVCLNNKLPYAAPFNYELSDKGNLDQIELDVNETRSLLTLLNSLVLNFYLRSKISATLNMFYMYELPIPKLSAVQKTKLADSAAKLLKNPRDVKERAALETFIARELYGLSSDDWKHLTGTFTFGSGDSKAELDEIICQSIALW